MYTDNLTVDHLGRSRDYRCSDVPPQSIGGAGQLVPKSLVGRGLGVLYLCCVCMCVCVLT